MKTLNRPRRILVPVKLTRLTGQLVRFAAQLAKRHGAALSILHVDNPMEYVPLEGFATSQPMSALTPSSERLGPLLKHFQSLAREVGADRVDWEVRVGTPARVILETAEEGDYDLILLGLYRWTWMEQWVSGSTSSQVAERSSVPVLLVPMNGVFVRDTAVLTADWRPRHITVATDLGPDFASLYDAAAWWAFSYGASVEVVHAVKNIYAQDELAPSETTIGKRAKQRINMALHGHHPVALPPIEVRAEVVEGEAASALRARFADRRTDLLVLGTHVHGTLRSAVKPCLLRRIAADATCPILAISLQSQPSARVSDPSIDSPDMNIR